MVNKKNFVTKLTARILVVLLVLSFSLTGCGKSKDNKSTNDQKTTEQTTEVKLEGEKVDAQLETKQNVIDDNYRNYYEIFVGSYCDSDGDGMGDLKGLISKLDYINDGNPETDTDLGCNGIWLMPINPSPSYHKYDVVNYEEIDDAYGSIDDFKQLIQECNKRGIKVIIDLVMNHSSVANPWFKEAKKYLENLPADQEPNAADCKYVDYYTFVKDNPGGKYYKVGKSDYYYEATFSQNMPELNLGSQEVRAEFEQISKFWLDLGAGGFRLDAAKEYYSGEPDKCNEVLKWFNDYVKSVNPNAYIVGETWCSDFSRYLESGIDSAFDFSYSSFDGNIALVAQNGDKTYNGQYFTKCLMNTQEDVNAHSQTAIQAPFIGNHDLNRTAHFLGFAPEKIKFAHGLLSIMSGSPFIYYGDEIGIGGSGADENKRSPMIWSTTDTKGQCKGPVNMQQEYVINKFASVEDQQKDKTSILTYVKNSVKLRNTFPEIARGTISAISEVTDVNVCAISKTYNDSKIEILANCSGSDTAYATVPRDKYGYTCIKGILTVGEEQPKQVGDTIVLPPYSIVVLK